MSNAELMKQEEENVELMRQEEETVDDAVLDFENEFILHMANKDALEFVLREGVTQDLLLTSPARKVYGFVQDHFSKSGKIASLKVLEVEFPDITFYEPDSTIEWVVDKLRHRYQKNEVGDLVVELANKVEQPKEAMRYLRDTVFEIERKSLSTATVYSERDYKMFLHNMQEKVMAGAFKGASIGFKEMDTYTGGVKDGNVCYILARPKRKKSFIVLNAFIAMAYEGRNPYLHTLELGQEEVTLRLACMLSGVSWDDAQKGQLSTAQWKALDAAMDKFQQYPHKIEHPPLDERTIPALISKADKAGSEAVLISQFRYVNGLKDWYRAPHEEQSEIAIDLKRAASRPGAERPFIIEAQFNRGGDSMEELEDFDPSKVGLTDMITQSGDTLYGLFESKDMRTSNQIEMGILEARNHGKAAWYIEAELVNQTQFRLVPGTIH